MEGQNEKDQRYCIECIVLEVIHFQGLYIRGKAVWRIRSLGMFEKKKTEKLPVGIGLIRKLLMGALLATVLSVCMVWYNIALVL
jgi:hypothetical protein